MATLATIEKYLASRKINYQIIDLGLPAKIFAKKKFSRVKVEDVIKTGLVNPEEVVKTLLVRTNDGFVALAIRGADRVDFKKVRRLFGSKSELAKPDEVQKLVGVPVGAVCPILLTIPLIFDRKVMQLMRVNLGSGDLSCGLEMDFSDLLKAVGAYQMGDLT